MKTKAIAIMAAMLAVGGLQAQYYNEYYHRTGDTIDYKANNGYYMWWGIKELLEQGHVVYPFLKHMSFNGSGVDMMAYFTSTPLKILGIAGMPYSTIPPGTVFVDTTSVPEYFYLFDNHAGAGSSGPNFLKRIQWDLTAPHRYLKIDGVNINYRDHDSCCNFPITTEYGRLYECYFDTAITVIDTFYVGWSFHNNDRHTTFDNALLGTYSGYVAASSILQHLPCTENDTMSYYDPWDNSICFFPVFEYLRCTDTSIASNPSYPNLQWSTYRSKSFAMVYPIIEIDTTQPPFYLCDPVQNVQVTADSCAVVTWDDFLHYTYCNVQYYALEDGYNTALTETVSGTNMLRICGLDSTKHYSVRVNAFCDTSKIETDWSAWVPFQLGGGTEGIEGDESVLSHYTYLVPNPASDRLTITSSFGITRVEIYNLSGILVYSEPAGFSNHSIDLRGWTAGQYIVMVHTPYGVTAKRLVVAK